MNKNLDDQQIFEQLYAVEDLSDLESDEESELFLGAGVSLARVQEGEVVAEVDQLNRVLDETQGPWNQ